MDVKSIINLSQTQRALTDTMLATNVNKCMAVENAKLRKLVASMAMGLGHIAQTHNEYDDDVVGAVAREMAEKLHIDFMGMNQFVVPLTDGQINDIVRQRGRFPPASLEPSTEVESQIVDFLLERVV